MNNRKESASLTGGIIAAVGASLCCTAPLVLLMLGVSGSWVSGFTVFEPYRPLFLMVVLLSFGYAGWLLYRPQPSCDSGTSCATNEVRSNRKILFWELLTVALILVTSPTWLPWFF